MIAGGSAGLGLVIARTFLSADYHIVIVGRDPGRLNLAAEQLRSSGGSGVTVLCGDMSERDQADGIAGKIADQLGRLDVLVNCIGASDRGLVEKLTAEQIHRLVQQNVIATLHCSQASLPLLIQSGGTVVNIGSLAGKVTARYLGGYNVAKHALTGLTGQMRMLLAVGHAFPGLGDWLLLKFTSSPDPPSPRKH